MENIEEQIKNVIHKLRPYLQRDGGDIEYVDFKDGIVYVRMLGACAWWHFKRWCWTNLNGRSSWCFRSTKYF